MVSQLEITKPLSSEEVLKIEEKEKIRLPKKECFPKLNKEMGHRVANLRDEGNNKRLCKKIISFYTDLDYTLRLAKDLNKGTLIEIKIFNINQKTLKNIYHKLQERYIILKIDIDILIRKGDSQWEEILNDFKEIIQDLKYIGESSGILKKKDISKEKSLYMATAYR